jgi:hypothetical protein
MPPSPRLVADLVDGFGLGTGQAARIDMGRTEGTERQGAFRVLWVMVFSGNQGWFGVDITY